MRLPSTVLFREWSITIAGPGGSIYDKPGKAADCVIHRSGAVSTPVFLKDEEKRGGLKAAALRRLHRAVDTELKSITKECQEVMMEIEDSISREAHG